MRPWSSIKSILVAGLLAGFAGHASAQLLASSAGPSQSTESLYSLDPATGALTLISVVDSSNGMPGIAFDGAGQLFALTGESEPNGDQHWYQLDPATGAVLNDYGVTTPENEWAEDLATQPGSGTIFVWDGRLGTIDPATAEFSFFADTVFEDMGAIAFTPDGSLYLVGHEAPAVLYQLNPADGVATYVADLDNGYMAMGADGEGRLLASTHPTSPGGDGQLFIIDPATGDETLLADTGVRLHDIAYFAPSYEPVPVMPFAGLGVMVLGLLLVARRRVAQR